MGDRWVAIGDALANGSYETLVDLLIDQNESVMESRGSAPWIERRTGRFHVRFQDEQGGLPQRNELPSLWRFPYFLDSLRSVATTLKEN